MRRLTQDQAWCHVFTFREGLLSPVGHDLRLRVTRFTLELGEQPLSVLGRFDAASLQVDCAVEGTADRTDALSEGDRRKIERAVRDEVLQARRHPEIVFRSQHIAPSGDGFEVAGELTLCGCTRPLRFRSRAQGTDQVAEVRLYQPDFGIRPYTALLGALRVRPDVLVRLGVPASEQPGS